MVKGECEKEVEECEKRNSLVSSSSLLSTTASPIPPHSSFLLSSTLPLFSLLDSLVDFASGEGEGGRLWGSEQLRRSLVENVQESVEGGQRTLKEREGVGGKEGEESNVL